MIVKHISDAKYGNLKLAFKTVLGKATSPLTMFCLFNTLLYVLHVHMYMYVHVHFNGIVTIMELCIIRRYVCT